ncbi:MAG TPA: TerC/Alx family metal homeostasis membrane protein [Lentimicrobium sp.]|nr:TerC/Alx family metal homeostasis membrane protein [Lentimicrobium sp.]
MVSVEVIFFVSFLILITGFLLLDLGVLDKSNHVVSFKSALFYTFVWIAVSIGFYILIIFHGDWIHLGPDGTIEELQGLISRYGHPIKINGLDYASAVEVYKKNLALEYITGYVIEWMLSLDNIFVMVVVFYAFKVKPHYYRRVLFYGILAAVVFRFLFIFTASALIHQFHWILYLFGILLIYTGIKMFFEKEAAHIDTHDHPVVKFASKYLPVYPRFARHHFFVHKEGRLMITPLFITLMVIEFSDVMFAVDSIPAIFAVTSDPFVIFFSNVFAILGLRSMFFVLIKIIDIFRYLKTGLAILMGFIGIKMLLGKYLTDWGFTTAYSLYTILAIMVISVVLSLIFPDKENTIDKKSR